MAANVRFLRTSKESQNNRTIFNQNTLYFVRDSRQLYQGENLLTSGIRLVEALPEAHLAAEQVIYFIVAQQAGYTVDRSKLQTAPQEAWVQVITPASQSEVTWEEIQARNYVTAQTLASYVTQDELTTAIQQLRADLTPIVEQVVPKVEQVAAVVKEQVVPVVSALSRIADEPTVQALTGLAETADQLVELVEVAATQNWVEQNFLTPEELATTLDDLDIITSEQVEQQLTNYAAKDHTHDQYLTQHQDLTDYAKKSDIPDISGKADIAHTHQEYLTELPEHSHEEYLTELPTHEHEDYASKAHEHSLAEITDYVAPDLSEYAKKSQIPNTSNLATKDQLSNYSKFSGSYNDLTDKPEIPNVPTNISAFTNDTGYLVENDLGDYAKLNDIQQLQSQVLFSENYYVTKPIGDFVLGQNVNTLTIRKLFETLLGLSTTEPSVPDEPDTPVQPEGIVEEIIVNKTPMYSVNAQGEIAAISYDDIIIYNQTTASAQPTESGFYQITDDAGKVIESGYQELTVNNPDIPYIIALPVGVDFDTMVTTQTYDTLEGKWKDDPFEMSNDFEEISVLCEELGVNISHINTDQYTLFADLESGPTGKIHRFIITE